MRIATRTLALLFLAAVCLSTSARADDPAASPQAKAYLAMQKMVDAGDYEGYKKAHTKEAASKMDQQSKEMKMDSKKMMAFMKEMSPKELKFASVKVEGKKATLAVTAKISGEANKGTVLLEDEGGWKVASESWTNAK